MVNGRKIHSFSLNNMWTRFLWKVVNHLVAVIYQICLGGDDNVVDISRGHFTFNKHTTCTLL